MDEIMGYYEVLKATRKALQIPEAHSIIDAATMRTQLWKHCQDFFIAQRITCPEAVWQSDGVIENAYEFIEGIGNIIGYAELEED